MKILTLAFLSLMPYCLFGQNDVSPIYKNFLSIGYGIFPADQGYKNLASSDGQSSVTSFSRPHPVTIKFEHFISKHFSIGINLNHYKYRIAWSANYENWDSRKVLPHQFVHQNGRTALIGRFNVGSTKSFHSWYIGLGLGIRLQDHYKETVSPTISSWGRDSDGVPLGAELSGGYRFFPFKKSRELGFYVDLGITQALLQLGIVWRADDAKNNTAKK
jgi:hypothetical protein